jgi:serine/threonine protein kinase
MPEDGRVEKRIENYRILAEIGRGGMGIIYKGLDEKKDQLVAIKVLPPISPIDVRRSNRPRVQNRARI